MSYTNPPNLSSRPLPRRKPFQPPTTVSTALPSSRSNKPFPARSVDDDEDPAPSSARSPISPTSATGSAGSGPLSPMPSRSKSTLKSGPPHDASKSDHQAVTDVMDQVESTGSLERAARKLQLYAKLTGMQAGPDVAAVGAGAGTSASGGSKGSGIGPPNGDSGSSDTAAVKRPAASASTLRAGISDPEEEIYRASGTNGRKGGLVDESAVEDDEDEVDGEEDDIQPLRRPNGPAGKEKDGSNGGSDMEQVVHLQEIVEGLWVGDLVAAMDSAGLEERGITNIVSLLRPRLSFPPQFSVFPLEIDDSPDTDILSHLQTCVAWIGEALRRRERSLGGDNQGSDDLSTTPESERDALIRRLEQTKPGGVLVHCQAGMSRSATVTAAYLMTALSIDPESAVEMIKDRRPVVDPSETFRYQLGLFYNADGKVTLRDRNTRHFYMERNATFFMNGQTSSPATDKMAKYPATPTPSNPPTPSGGHGRRKIRCKMCRRLLAVREHMMDHILDQSPVSRPRTPSNFALPAPMHMHRMSIDEDTAGVSMERRGSTVSDIVNPLTGLPGARSRQPSMTGTERPTIVSPLSLNPDSSNSSGGSGQPPVPRASTPGLVLSPMTPMDSSRISPATEVPVVETPGTISRSNSLDTARRKSSSDSLNGRYRRISSAKDGSAPNGSNARALQSADQLASRLPPHLQALRSGSSLPGTPQNVSPPSSPEKETSGSASAANGGPMSSSNFSSADVAKSVARRRSMLSMTPTDGPGGRERRGSGGAFGGEIASGGPPILVNPRCSGYFVEPLTWMEGVLKNGDISGKLVCPNDKCGAKIGNFDWAGVQCGCREWVTPGFCISRSKVDEVW